MSKVAVITPTGDRPQTFRLLEKAVMAQTRPPNIWSVSDDGIDPTLPGLGQWYLRTERPSLDVNNVKNVRRAAVLNVIAALGGVPPGYHVLVMEDDDWYPPDYVERHAEALDAGAMIAGMSRGRMYQWRSRWWHETPPRQEISFGETAFHASQRSTVEEVLATCFRRGKSPCAHMWRSIKGATSDLPARVAFKGIPGRGGVTASHHYTMEEFAWHRDRGHKVLRSWLGDQTDGYIEAMSNAS